MKLLWIWGRNKIMNKWRNFEVLIDCYIIANLVYLTYPHLCLLGSGGIKRPKSPSPPLVQLYSPTCSSSSLQSSYDMSHHPTAAAGTIPGQGDIPRPPFQQMGTKISGPTDNMLPNYQVQQVNTNVKWYYLSAFCWKSWIFPDFLPQGKLTG